MEQEYTVTLYWDDEASVWIATSEDIYGLILEHESFDFLIQRVRLAIPELLAFDESSFANISIDFAVLRKEKLALNG